MLRRRVAAWVLGAWVPAAAFADAHAADPRTRECLASYEQSQRLRQELRLREAREQLVLCARDLCPSEISKDCQAWQKEVDSAMPSVVIAARGPDGKDVAEVRVLVDGKLLLEKLDGKAVDMDPGWHVFRYESSQGDSLEERVLVREGAKLQELTVRFGPKPLPKSSTSGSPATLPPAESTTSPLLWVGFGIGGAGLLLGAVTGVLTLSKSSSLEDKCGGKVCPTRYQDDLDSAQTLGWITNISLGVGVVGIGVGVAALLSGRKPESAGSKATPKTPPALRVAPLIGVQHLGLAGEF